MPFAISKNFDTCTYILFHINQIHLYTYVAELCWTESPCVIQCVLLRDEREIVNFELNEFRLVSESLVR